MKDKILALVDIVYDKITKYSGIVDLNEGSSDIKFLENKLEEIKNPEKARWRRLLDLGYFVPAHISRKWIRENTEAVTKEDIKIALAVVEHRLKSSRYYYTREGNKIEIIGYKDWKILVEVESDIIARVYIKEPFIQGVEFIRLTGDKDCIASKETKLLDRVGYPENLLMDKKFIEEYLATGKLLKELEEKKIKIEYTTKPEPYNKGRCQGCPKTYAMISNPLSAIAGKLYIFDIDGCDYEDLAEDIYFYLKGLFYKYTPVELWYKKED